MTHPDDPAIGDAMASPPEPEAITAGAGTAAGAGGSMTADERELYARQVRRLQEQLDEARAAQGNAAAASQEPHDEAPEEAIRRDVGSVEAVPTAKYGARPAELHRRERDGSETVIRGLIAFGYAGKLWHVKRYERWPALAFRWLDRGSLWDGMEVALDAVVPGSGLEFLQTGIETEEIAEVLAELAEAQGADPEQFRALAG